MAQPPHPLHDQTEAEAAIADALHELVRAHITETGSAFAEERLHLVPIGVINLTTRSGRSNGLLKELRACEHLGINRRLILEAVAAGLLAAAE